MILTTLLSLHFFLSLDSAQAISTTTKIGTENEVQKKRLEFLASEAIKFRTSGEAINDYQSQVVKLEQEKSSVHGELSLLQDKLRYVEQQLEIAHRSIAIQNKYELGQGKNVGSREVLRTLYLEVGKREAESHALALKLSDSDELRRAAVARMREAQQTAAKLEATNKDLASDVSAMSRQRLEHKEAIEKQDGEIERLKLQGLQLNARLDDEMELVVVSVAHIEILL
jgi:septal ring factor EnvC (AmiA/AmiB activator)